MYALPHVRWNNTSNVWHTPHITISTVLRLVFNKNKNKNKNRKLASVIVIASRSANISTINIRFTAESAIYRIGSCVGGKRCFWANACLVKLDEVDNGGEDNNNTLEMNFTVALFQTIKASHSLPFAQIAFSFGFMRRRHIRTSKFVNISTHFDTFSATNDAISILWNRTRGTHSRCMPVIYLSVGCAVTSSFFSQKFHLWIWAVAVTNGDNLLIYAKIPKFPRNARLQTLPVKMVISSVFQ